MRYLSLVAVAVVVSLAIGCSTAEAGGNRVQVLRDRFGRVVRDDRGRAVFVQSRSNLRSSRSFRSQNGHRPGSRSQRERERDRELRALRRERERLARQNEGFRRRSRGFGVELFRDSSIFGVRRGFRIGF